MTVDYIIVGQGICGSFLSWNLMKAGKSVLVIDESHPFTSSKVASGVINPVTGRRVITVWMASELFPFCEKVYKEFGDAIGANLIEQKHIISFAHTPQMLEAYRKKNDEQGSYVRQVADSSYYDQWFNRLFDCFEISPVYLINLHALMTGWRQQLAACNALLEEQFDDTLLQVEQDFIQYKNIQALKIVFCGGIQGFETVYWKNLPYVYNKGEALIADIPGLPANHIYKYGTLTIVPWQDGLWWIGSTYENKFETAAPTESFRNAFTAALKRFLKVPFQITDHIAAIRPAAVERRPFVGLHPHYPAIGILNGMGTKGCSIGPWFAAQLADHLINHTPIDPVADVSRFKRILLS